MNVDELFQHVSPGQLEVTESELILYQRGNAATKWPLRCLRRYGFDEEIFSFESGRRCPTGPGIYAFRCRRAEQLFNLLQQNIQLRNLTDELALPGATGASAPGPPVTSRQPVEQLNYLDNIRPILPRTQTTTTAQNRFSSRTGSITSNNGINSSPSASSPTPLTSEPVSEHNNNKRLQHSYSNTVPLLETDSSSNTFTAVTQPYMNLHEPTSSPTLSSSSEPYAQLNMDSELECCHVYMNVTPGVPTETLPSQKSFEQPLLSEEEKEDLKHCYANLNPGELLHNEQTKRMNYIVLDLDSKNDGTGAAVAVAPPPPESPRKVAKGYATIDFNRTVALSHSVNPCLDLDSEGSRKTRHNSTIGELAPILARHSTSLSD